MATPEWETSKENIAPLARGRNVEVLTKALSKSPAVLEQERLQHQASISDAASGVGPYAPDPLVPWVSYVKWAIDNFPRGSNTVIAAVEGACRTFSKDPRYLGDRRFVRLWVRYADMRKDKLDVFEYMQRRRIGERAALFYEAWATTLELERQYEKAEATYQLGSRVGAEPSDRLAQREREFFNRMEARRKRAQKKAKDAADKKVLAEKVAETAKAGRGRNALADSILSRQDPVDDEDSDMPPVDGATGSLRRVVQMERPALGRISERQAQTGLRPVVPMERKWTSGPADRPRIQSNVQSSGMRKEDRIDVYVDPGPVAVSPNTARQDSLREKDNCPLPLIAKIDEARKENSGALPAKWAGETLPQDENAVSRMQRGRRGGLAPRQEIEIFQDSAKDGSVHGQEAEAPVPKQPNVSSVQQQQARSPSPTRKRSTRYSAAVSPTISTKLAMQEVDDMFSSELPVEMKRDAVREETFSARRRAVQKKAPTFEIFKDVDDNSNKENALGVVKGSGQFSGNPALEKRVLQPIPELEGPYIPIEEDDLETENADVQNASGNILDENMDPRAEHQHGKKPDMENQKNVSESEGTNELLEFLAEWCFQESTYFLLDGPDPEVEKNGMFDLHPKQNVISDDHFDISPFKPHSVVSFDVDNVLWKGHDGNSIVVPVEDMENIFELKDPSAADDEDAPDDLIAMKVSETSNAWEYYIYKTLHDRYGAPLKSVANAIAFYEGSPRTYLVLDSMYVCSLAEAMTLTNDKHFTESMAMFFTADLLKTIEALHTVGIIHCDVTLDNILFRNNHIDDLVEERFMANGVGSWGNKGILLVDFNHAVDSKQAVSNDADTETLATLVAKLGNNFLDEDYRIPGASSWSFNTDCYAAAVCSAKMLGLSKLTTKDSPSPLKHARIWEVYFKTMQSLSATTKPAQTVDTMRRCREEMEGALVGEKWLKVSIERLSIMAESKDIHDEITMGNA